MAQITLGGSLGHNNPVLSIIDILDAQGGMRTIPTFTNGALSTEFSGIPNKIKQYVSAITVQDTNSIYYLTGLTATETGSWTPLAPMTGGVQGPQGFDGFQGPQGFQGPKSTDGANSMRWAAGTTAFSGGTTNSFNFTSYTFSLVTGIILSVTNSDGINVGAWLQDLASSQSINTPVKLQIRDTTNNSIFGTYTVTGYTNAGLPGGGSYLVLDLSFISGSGTIVTGREYSISWAKTGIQGPQGYPGNSTGLVYYFNNNLPNQGAGATAFRDLDRVISIGATTSISNTITSSAPVLFASFITPDNEPLITNLNGGVWEFELWADTTASALDHGIYAKVYKYDLGATSTLLSTASPVQIFVTSNSLPKEYRWSIPIADSTLLGTDRILIELYGVANASPFNKTLTLYFNNNTIGRVRTTMNPFYGATGPQGPSGVANLSGTPNYVTKFTGVTSVGNSNITDTGTDILINVGGTSSVRVNTALTVGDNTYPAGSNVLLSLSRTQSSTGFFVGNPLAPTPQGNFLDFNNTLGSGVRSNSYLQIGASSGVYFTTGATLSTTTTYQDNTGRWGFGTTATSFARLNILEGSISGRESIMSVQISDNINDRYILANGTTLGARFIPAHVGFVNGDYSSLIFRGLGSAANDLGTEPYVQFRSAITSSSTDPNNGTLTNPTTRPLFTFGSVNESMRILANGNVGIGTSLPTQKLHVVSYGDPAKFEFTGLSAGDNFLFIGGDFGDDISLLATKSSNSSYLLGMLSDGSTFFSDFSIVSYADKSVRINGGTTFAKTVEYDLPNTPVVATGEIVRFGTTPVPLVAGDIYYYSSSGAWEPAGITANGSNLLGIPLGPTVSNGILIEGFAKFPGNTNYTGFATNGARQYLNSTPGSFSEVGPTGSGDVVRIIGYCVDTDTLYFRPDTAWVTI